MPSQHQTARHHATHGDLILPWMTPSYRLYHAILPRHHTAGFVGFAPTLLDDDGFAPPPSAPSGIAPPPPRDGITPSASHDGITPSSSRGSITPPPPPCGFTP
jgi:hypothetical protein